MSSIIQRKSSYSMPQIDESDWLSHFLLFVSLSMSDKSRRGPTVELTIRSKKRARWATAKHEEKIRSTARQVAGASYWETGSVKH